jgi:mRNA interferase RelE/StbE
MPYSLSFSRQAIKDLEKLNEPFYSNIKQAIFDLTENPRPHGYIKLKGRTGYRIRVGNYRVIYDIFDALLVVDVITIGHRKDIYD